jgi:putative (di)nucleoside polyphosphate hydrolase
MNDQPPIYRPSVGAILYNSKANIFMAERLDTPGAWQLPQGGIHSYEIPEQALKRELKEEIGTSDIILKQAHPKWLTYEIPPQYRKKSKDPSWQNVTGQRQKWFLACLLPQAQININTPNPEFSNWCWMPMEKALIKAPKFKYELYQTIFSYFRPFIEKEVLLS